MRLPLLFTAALAILPAALTLGCQSSRPPAAPASPPTSASLAAPSRVLPDDGLVDIGGGESVHVHCAGAGSPLVLFEECLGCEAAFYRAMQDGIAHFTRACAYDRAGVGYSSAAPKPHLAHQIVGDLHKLLGQRDESGRVVLVGHGLGGLIAQIYARDFPSAVAGMVLVDSQTKDTDSRYYAAYPPDAVAKMKELLGDTPENLDIDDQFRAMDDLRSAPLSLGDRPLVVVSRGKSQQPSFGIPADSWEKLETLFRGLQAEVPSLSKNSAQIVATEAHWIPDEAPDRVVTATWQVVSSARTGIRLSHLAAAASAEASMTASSSPVAAAMPAPPDRAHGAPVDDGLFDIGGRSLHLHCAGRGTPTVLLEAGHGADGGTWQRVQTDIAKQTRACAYDRAGLGFSDKPGKPRAVADILQDLRALLATAGITGPYVLVGHSIGALYVRLYAAAHPDEVAGMVLVDGSTEDEDLREWSLLPPELLKMLDDPADPEAIRLDAFRAAMAQLRGANRSIGDRPLVVLTAGLEEQVPGVSPELSTRLARIGQEMQAELPHRISSNAAQIVARKSHHYIQMENPKLVIASVRQVVDAARGRGRVDEAALAPLANEGGAP
jgi:pimeloyl-ACP methyl ester carboxylesterase